MFFLDRPPIYHDKLIGGGRSRRTSMKKSFLDIDALLHTALCLLHFLQMSRGVPIEILLLLLGVSLGLQGHVDCRHWEQVAKKGNTPTQH